MSFFKSKILFVFFSSVCFLFYQNSYADVISVNLPEPPDNVEHSYDSTVFMLMRNSQSLMRYSVNEQKLLDVIDLEEIAQHIEISHDKKLYIFHIRVEKLLQLILPKMSL